MMGSPSGPALVSIGLPVYNEAAHVDAALQALRAQDYPTLEILVCDNASTDETLAICQRHAAQDARIRIEPASRNIGVTANFRRALDLAHGDYFMWASGHDLWSTNYVSQCLVNLEANPGACLAFASAHWIGPAGEPLAKRSGWSDTRGMAPLARFFTVFWGNMHSVLGLMRCGPLRDCGPLPAIVGGDLVLLSALALKGDFVHATSAHWSRRELRAEVSYQQKVQRYASSQFGVSQSWMARHVPLLALPVALIRLILGSDLGWLDKTITLLALPPSLALRWLVGRRGNRP